MYPRRGALRGYTSSGERLHLPLRRLPAGRGNLPIRQGTATGSVRICAIYERTDRVCQHFDGQAVAKTCRTIAAFRMGCQRRMAGGTCWRGLFKSVVEIGVRPMSHVAAELGTDCSRVGIM